MVSRGHLPICGRTCEFLLPFASVVRRPTGKAETNRPSRVVTAITKDVSFTERLLGSPLVERLNPGSINTMKISLDQPHEGNMFELLRHRLSIERA